MSTYLTKKIKEKQRQIEELSNAKVDFMNDVMHETKSPLTSIIGYTDLLLKGSFGETAKEQKEPLHIIQRQSTRMLNMINDMFGLARLESGRVKITKCPVSLPEVIEHAIVEMRPQIDAKKIKIIQEIDPQLPSVPMDETRILEVLINLLSNAVKFSNPQGKILISARPLKKEVEVSIRDEGSGIEPVDLPHIFEKFYRTCKESGAVKGTGLGLAFSKSVVEAHGGKMWAASGGPGQGAVFHFTLPL